MKTSLTLLIIAFAFSLSAQVTQWRGPNRDGQFTETGLLKEWPADGPELVMQIEKIGKGYSSAIPEGDMIYTTGMIDTLDYLTAINPDGSFKYQVPYGRSWNNSFPDTRSTPVIDNDRIYVESGTGRVACLNKETGEEIWAVEVDKDFETEYHVWGNSETPLVVDNLVICTPAGSKTSVVAFDKMTGDLVWQSQSVGGARAYASATVYEFNGHRYILAITGMEILALVPETGEIAWHYKYFDPAKWSWQPNGLIWTNTPVFKDNNIFITMGYDYPAVMLEMDSTGTSVSEKFVDHTFDNHHHGVILTDGYLYGSNWFDNKRGRWVCMNWETGEIKYVADWDTKGSMVMADGLLYCYNERGNVGLVKPDPDGFEVISQFKITEGAGPHWAHPYIANGKLYIRHGEVLMVYAIKA
ncbi:PQQ-binding-like beta-propeller repeat protein [Draconibacterium sp. IB214405]|uniref:PQQ-binding-like beta-propeller repeat protein n=1 Tax=Draconibacterium sp. IB214405 TaxID=3097352 RepID=UPI002A14B05C|nr:PQQ-binding-like beta-propeller repeat protein [Draconibacterium sp. IB214405]MDX8341228.1 PQQ-binding-like beta-propeller repeat protein [Draconibacterium sp. IB214405]